MLLHDFIGDPSIIEALSDPGSRTIMVIGGSDTGKTTLIELLADRLSARTKVGIVDLDIGQSHIGPPTTIAWGKVYGRFKGWRGIAVEDFYFTGTVSPFGSPVPALVGAKLITDKALSKVRKVIVDTTGLIAEPVGRALKQYKIDILCPDIVLALERAEELGHILDPFRSCKAPRIYRLSTPARISAKSAAKRADYRFRKIRAYFAHSKVIEISLDEIGIRFTKETFHLTPAGLKNRIVSFRGRNNKDFALGVIIGTRTKQNKLLIRTPVEGITKSSTVVIGRTELDIAESSLRDRP